MENINIKKLFNKLVDKETNTLSKINLKRFLNILKLQIDGIDLKLTTETFTFDEVINIINNIIKEESESFLIKFDILELELYKTIDKKTVRYLLASIYGNKSPHDKVDIRKLEKFTSHI